MISRFYQSILDYVLPQVCCVCRSASPEAVCPNCISKIPVHIERFETEMRLPVQTVTPYQNSVMVMIHSLKYSRLISIGVALGKWLCTTLDSDTLENVDILIPVPLHRNRFREREFNQCVVIFSQLGSNNQIPLVAAVKRVKNTAALHMLNKDARKNELTDSFEVDETLIQTIQNRRVMIVDDICTTGATFDEIARQLTPFVASISCLALAHTPKSA